MSQPSDRKYFGKRYRTTMLDKSTGKKIIWETDKVTVDNNMTWLKPIRKSDNVMDPVKHWGTDVRLKMKNVDRQETDNKSQGDI